MFRHRQRRPPFADFINWTDYHWDPVPRPQGPIRGPWRQPGQFGIGQLLLAGLVVLLGAKVFSAYRNHRGSWLGKAVLGGLVLMIFASLSSRRSRSFRW